MLRFIMRVVLSGVTTDGVPIRSVVNNVTLAGTTRCPSCNLTGNARRPPQTGDRTLR
jgi:hypothetical protein